MPRRLAAENPVAMPVKMAAGALGPNMPPHDRCVWPGHAMRIGETLILARKPVNGMSITRPQWVDEIHHFAGRDHRPHPKTPPQNLNLQRDRRPRLP